MRHTYFKNYFPKLPSWKSIIRLLDANVESETQIEVFDNLGFFIKNSGDIHEASLIKDHLHKLHQEKPYPNCHVYCSLLSSSKTVGYHRDRTDVYIVQAQGKTKYQVNERGEEFEYTLSPSDMLYIPAHVWHNPIVFEPRAVLSIGFDSD